jgi:hypothetical protein
MKHLLNGVVIAAAVAITGPVWAQTGAPMTPMAPAAPPAASSMSPEEPTATTRHHRARHHRVVRHSGRGGKAGSEAGMTEQLNRQELSRIQGGAAGPGMAPAPMPAEGGIGPRPSGGTGRGR